MLGGLAHPTYYKLDFLHLQAVLPGTALPALGLQLPDSLAHPFRQTDLPLRLPLPSSWHQHRKPTCSRAGGHRSPGKILPKAEGNGMAQAGVPPGMLLDTCSSQHWGMARDGLAELEVVGGKGGFPEGRCFPSHLDRDWPVLLLLAVF